jgi:hypothetical protein
MAADFEGHDFEGKDIQQVLERWRDSANQQANRPDWFWSRQRAQLMSKIAEQGTSTFPKLAWASLAATVAIAVSLVLPIHQEKKVEPQAQLAQEAAEISDHDLMLAIERSMNQGVPSSLAPASLLANEMNQALVTKAQPQKAKEKRFAN